MPTLEHDENKSVTTSYHHGDLRNTLIRLGAEMLAESGEASLSLRKLAQRAGVSHNAPYQHFADKNALIAAIAEEGFRLLGVAIDDIVQPDADPMTRLRAVGRSYVTFAMAHPNHLQVMFSAFPNSDYPSLAAQSHYTLNKLIQIVHEVQMAGHLEADNVYDAASVIWMTLHGLSAIWIAGKIPDTILQDRSPEVLAERFIEMICVGLLK